MVLIVAFVIGSFARWPLVALMLGVLCACADAALLVALSSNGGAPAAGSLALPGHPAVSAILAGVAVGLGHLGRLVGEHLATSPDL